MTQCHQIFWLHPFLYVKTTRVNSLVITQNQTTVRELGDCSATSPRLVLSFDNTKSDQ